MPQTFTTRKPGRLLAGATIVFLTVVWGTTWAAIRVMLEGIPPITGVALRFFIAAALLTIACVAMGLPMKSTGPRESALRAMHGLLSFCISYGVVFWAEQWVPSGLAAVLFATFPLIVAVMAHFWLHGERMSGPSLAGTIVGFVGIAVIFGEDFALLGGSVVAVAAAVMLISPLVAAFASVAVKRWGDGIHPVPFNASAMAWSSVIMAVLAWVVERDRTIDLTNWPAVAALVYLAVFGSALTFTLFFWLLQHMQARQLSLIGYGTPVVALIVGAVFMDEPITPTILAGSGLVVVGVALASHRSRAPKSGAGSAGGAKPDDGA